MYGSGKLRIVKADHGQLLRDADISFVCGNNSPEAHPVARRYHRGHILVSVYQAVHSRSPAVDGIFSLIDQLFRSFDSGLLQGLSVPAKPLSGSMIRLRAGKEANSFVPLLCQKAYRRTHCLIVIHTDTVAVQSVNLPVNQHHRFSGLNVRKKMFSG